MKKLLITGFEPFGGEETNPSWEAVSRLPETIGGFTLVKRRLPVVFGKAADLLKQETADVILCVGQAGGRSAVTPEFVGINLRHATLPDNEGNQPKDQPILAAGDCAYFSTLPVRAMAEAIAAEGIPATVSYSAGTYVCNDVLYSLLAHSQGTDTRVGFIHVPYCTEQNKTPALAMEQIVKALTVAVETIEKQGD